MEDRAPLKTNMVNEAVEKVSEKLVPKLRDLAFESMKESGYPKAPGVLRV